GIGSALAKAAKLIEGMV
uniref:Caerulein precursor fragment-related peptide BM3 n=1 Tax=Xenopus boumbaensis TaxID=288550 RepID=CRBM3_XENBM|nr:RecName: Full=Caerulein precursor fragment-related peptide BM3; AltName: Full=CPF-RP-BM3 [Xenopus boumbaensis]